MKSRIPTWAGPLLGAAIFVIVVGLLEAASYLFGSFGPKEDPLLTTMALRRESDPEWRKQWLLHRQSDDLLFWKINPNLSIEGLQTNSMGLRSEEIGPADPLEYRVLSLGESTTFGLKVAYEETYTALLQKTKPPPGRRRLRVINAGVPGYALVQGYAFLKYWGLDLEPDAVILYFGKNDFLPVAHFDKRLLPGEDRDRGLNDWELLKKREQIVSRLGTWLYDRSNFFRGLWTLAHRTQPSSGEAQSSRSKLRVPAAHREMVLSRIARLCEERGIQLTIVIPWYRKFDLHEELLRTFGARNEIPLVDLPRRLANLPKEREAYFADPTHPNGAGHALIAAEIWKVVETLWR